MIIYEPTKERDTWIDARPPEIKLMIKSHPPNRLYLYKPTDHRVILYSYDENRTVTVTILFKYNRDKILGFERRVFGIDLKDLEECDLPYDLED